MQRKQRLFVLILIVLLLAVGLSGCGMFNTKTKVNGTVKEQAGAPIAGAIVALGEETTTTGADGTFAFEEVARGSYALTVTLNDEVIYQDTVVISGKAMTLNIEYVYVLTPEKEVDRAIPGATPTVSSVHNSASTAVNLVDGDLDTVTKRWISNSTDAEPYAILSFAEAVSVDTVVIYSGNQKPDDDSADIYRLDTVVIEAMQDSEWVAVATITGNEAYRCISEFTKTTASSWRFRFIKSNNLGTADNRARVFEIRILEAR